MRDIEKLPLEKQLRIKAIEAECIEEIEKVPEGKLTKWPDMSMEQEFRDLEKKYRPQIMAILNEEDY